MHPTWTEQWWPVAYVRDLDQSKPTRFTLLERDLVIWWDPSAALWRAFPDVCPHRLVPLSEGRINERGELECPYHGWSFDGEGRCQHIPQAEEGTRSDSLRSRCDSLPSATAQELLFVWTGAPEAADPDALPLVPQLEDNPESWTVQDTFRDLPMDALTLLENVLDVSHVPFTPPPNRWAAQQCSTCAGRDHTGRQGWIFSRLGGGAAARKPWLAIHHVSRSSTDVARPRCQRLCSHPHGCVRRSHSPR